MQLFNLNSASGCWEKAFRQVFPCIGPTTGPALPGKIFQGKLDFTAATAQKQWSVFSPSNSFYTQWRLRSRPDVLRDADDFPSERLLQAIWQHQRLRRGRFKTADGRKVRVFHPGFASVEGGPDFRSAVLQIGDEAPRSGDVEIDLRTSGWRSHGHDRNPNFKNVLLHVVWEDAKPIHNAPAILAAKNFLDAPLAELALALENESLRALPENLRGKCSAPMSELNEAQLTELLREAAGFRFQTKAGQFRSRAKHVGWEQALWENVFRALGYKHNVWPMQNLAETRSRWLRCTDSAFALQARLFGVSGLLPNELTRSQKSSDTCLRRVWDFWWREREEFNDCFLPRASWKFHGLRPANHPQRRLALVAHWLADRDFIAKIENWCATGFSDKKLLVSLRNVLEVKCDDFWSWHWTFRSARLPKPQPLLGDARTTDLAANVILPWLWVRAVEGKNKKLQRVIEQRYFAWPAAEDNSVLKLARQRLLGTANPRILKSAAAQQGLMQIVRDFCGHSNALCANCRFPEVARNWKGQNPDAPLTSLQGSQTDC